MRRFCSAIFFASLVGALLVGSSAPASAATTAFGRDVPGTQWLPMGSDYKRASRFTLQQPATITDLVAYLDGLGGPAGSQQVRFALYSLDRKGAPDALLAQSEVGTISAGAAAQWVDLSLQSPEPLAAGDYYLTILSGSTARVARYSRAPLSSGLRTANDTFADGASNTFGSATSDNYVIAIYAAAAPTVVTPPPANLSLPVVNGTAQVGQTLTGSDGFWSNNPLAYAYQWQRCNSGGGACADLAGETGDSYVVDAADVGSTLRIEVTATNDGGSATVVSAPSSVVTDNPPVAFGRQTSGTQWFVMSANAKRSSRFVLASGGQVTDLVAYLDGRGASRGSQQVRFALYGDQSGEPGGLIAQTTIGTIAAGAVGAWMDLPLTSPVRLPSGIYHLAILSGDTARVAEYSRAPLAGGLRSASDTFSDGASNLYGPAASDDYQIAIYATGSSSTPVPVDVTPPSVPSGLTVTGTSSSTVGISWTASTDGVGVLGYDVFVNGARVGTSAGTSYTFGGLVCGTTYTLGVDAFDAAGNASQAASVSGSTGSCSGGGGGGGVSNASYVSPSGSDSNPGTLDRPWRTIGKAMATLTAGATAYLRAGVYSEALSGSCGLGYNKLIWTASGTAAAPITISGYPGEEKQVVVKSAVRLAGDYLRLQNLVVDKNAAYSSFDNVCNGAPNAQLYGQNDTLSGVEVRNSSMSGVYLEGADGATVVGNWIHDNGTHWNLDHGVYWLSGANSLLASNIVQDNYANGIKVGPDAQSVLVTENTVVGNGRSGVIVSGDTQTVSNNNTVANNILANNGTDSTGGYGLRDYWESKVGTGNRAYRNLIWGNSNGPTLLSAGGLSVTGSLLVDPLFVSLGLGDFHLSLLSPAVDAADPAYVVSSDYAGSPRPQGRGPDIGAYER
jgi:hypothetical protein